MNQMSEILSLIEEAPDLEAFPAHRGRAATVFEAGAAAYANPYVVIDVEEGDVRLNWRHVLASTNGRAKNNQDALEFARHQIARVRDRLPSTLLGGPLSGEALDAPDSTVAGHAFETSRGAGHIYRWGLNRSTMRLELVFQQTLGGGAWSAWTAKNGERVVIHAGVPGAR